MMRKAEDIERIVRLEAERDALAAHVELLSRAAYEVCNDSFSYGGTSMAVNAAGDLATGDRGKYPCPMTALAEAAVSAPTTSLARLKAQWQAEALEKMLGVNDAGIEKMMMELRRQAEEAPGPVSPDQEAP